MQHVRQFSRALKFAAVTLLALCLSALSHAASPVLDRVVEKGVLRVAMTGDQPPFNAYSVDEQLIGFDVDFAEAIAGIMNVKLEIVRVPFGQLIDTVVEGKADMVISGMSITPARARQVSFAGPYMLSGKTLLSTNKRLAELQDGAGFNKADIKLVALQNSTSEAFVKRDLPDASYSPVARYDEGIEMLVDGDIDAVVADMPVLALSILRNPDSGLRMLEPPVAIEPLGIALSNTDDHFLNLVNNYLSTFENTGLIAKLHKRWFRDSDWVIALP